MENVNVKIVNEEIYVEKPLKSLEVLTQKEPLTVSMDNLINLSTDIISSNISTMENINIETSVNLQTLVNDSILFENLKLKDENINQQNINQQNIDNTSLFSKNNDYVNLVEEINNDMSLNTNLNLNIEDTDLNFETTLPSLQVNIENLNI